MFFVLSRAWDKENILSSHEESNLLCRKMIYGSSFVRVITGSRINLIFFFQLFIFPLFLFYFHKDGIKYNYQDAKMHRAA